MIGPYVVSAFAVFKRPMTYIRGDDEIATYGFASESPTDLLLAGDTGQTPAVVTMTVEDMQLAGVFPPQKYDRVLFNGRSHAVREHRVQYDGEIPVLVRLRCEG